MDTPNLPSSQIFEAADSPWGASVQPAGCPACKRVYLIEATRLGQACPQCARGKLEAQPAILRPEAPELLAPFRYNLNSMRPNLEKFTSEVWLRPADLEAATLLQRATPLYWPMWLVDGDVTGHWQAEAGFDYQVKSSQESYGSDGWSSRDVVETRVRWEPRLGQIQRHYDNVITPALTEQKQLLKLTGQYQREQAKTYQPEQVKGAVLRIPDLPPQNAWPLAQPQLDEAAEAECQEAARAQHIRNFTIRADYQSLHWTQLLLPLYVTWYTDDDGKPRMVYINGQSGVIGGPRIASQKKGWQMAGVVLTVAAVLFLLTLCLGAIGLAFPPAWALAILLGVVSLLVACGAIIPAAWPAQWNRTQGE